jgi:hypothetical protein
MRGSRFDSYRKGYYHISILLFSWPVSSVTPQYGEQLYVSFGRLHEINRLISTNLNLLLNIQTSNIDSYTSFSLPSLSLNYTMLESASYRKAYQQTPVLGIPIKNMTLPYLHQQKHCTTPFTN